MQDKFKDIPGLKNNIAQYSGITADSREVRRGSLFVAIKGLQTDSHQLIDEVIRKGALAIVGEIKPKKSWYSKTTYIQVPDS